MVGATNLHNELVQVVIDNNVKFQGEKLDNFIIILFIITFVSYFFHILSILLYAFF